MCNLRVNSARTCSLSLSNWSEMRIGTWQRWHTKLTLDVASIEEDLLKIGVTFRELTITMENGIERRSAVLAFCIEDILWLIVVFVCLHRGFAHKIGYLRWILFTNSVLKQSSTYVIIFLYCL